MVNSQKKCGLVDLAVDVKLMFWMQITENDLTCYNIIFSSFSRRMFQNVYKNNNNTNNNNTFIKNNNYYYILDLSHVFCACNNNFIYLFSLIL